MGLASWFLEKGLQWLQVLQEPGVSKEVLKARAKGLKRLGGIFEVSPG